MKIMTTERIWHYYDTLDCNTKWVSVDEIIQRLRFIIRRSKDDADADRVGELMDDLEEE